MSAEGFVSQIPAGPAPAPVANGARDAVAAAQEKAIARFRPTAAVPTIADPAGGMPAKIEMDPAALKEITRTSAALRVAEQKVKELQTAAQDSAQVIEAKKLYASGKRLEAIALLSGKDATEEMAALMDAYLNVTPAEPVDPAAAKLAELEKWKNDQIKAQEDEKKAAAEQAIKQRDAAIQGFAWSVLDAEKLPDGTPKFSLSAAKKNRGEAAVAALRLVSQVYAPKEYPSGDVTPEQARALFAKAFADVEAEYERQYAEELGTRFVPRTAVSNPRPGTGQPAQAAPRPATTEPTPTEPTRANASPTLSRPSISTRTWPASLTPQQALQKAIERIQSFQK